MHDLACIVLIRLATAVRVSQLAAHVRQVRPHCGAKRNITQQRQEISQRIVLDPVEIIRNCELWIPVVQAFQRHDEDFGQRQRNALPQQVRTAQEFAPRCVVEPLNLPHVTWGVVAFRYQPVIVAQGLRHRQLGIDPGGIRHILKGQNMCPGRTWRGLRQEACCLRSIAWCLVNSCCCAGYDGGS